MEDKHFEVVTARSLADKIVDAVRSFQPWQSIDAQKDTVEYIIEPHIHKSSDCLWMRQASSLLQRCAISGSDGHHLSLELKGKVMEFLNRGYVTADVQWVDENMLEPSDVDKPMFNLEADIEWLVRGCMRIMHNKQDGDGEAYRELRDFVLQKIRPTGPETNSVPARCEEAYNEAISLLHGAWNTIRESGTGSEIENWRDRAAKLMGGPNPFKEADIVDKEKDKQPEQVLLPFDLKAAQSGSKVVTRDGRGAKIVADGLDGNNIAAVVKNEISQSLHQYHVDGCYNWLGDNPLDLFILKEPETITIRILKHKETGEIDVLTPGQNHMNPHVWELIKTVTETI